MTKDQIIHASLEAMRRDQGLFAIGAAGDDSTNEYEAIVIATLTERLPEGDVRTCEDFRYLGAACCDICHSSYPHFDMYLHELPDSGKAWICCSVRSALSDASQH
jgi:hypothetical protein